ncbi:bifunctional riboflavin biosynthesis protein RIBA 1, chloroplastic [Nicotiana tabacum]|uniref:Bifunctional riboflavin biosynthesis protein RIBA 1, chloroplastic n=2 Tax=Nicotiana TaxID=4085 RepID=A0A1S3ZRV5_TOBAC|nr:PREDICTED: bifunctional riboflavin biosynthesis protein RIBA 1, chloroplastic-like [Nicotiana sylvestris]XP_016467131.1 PREDICTED: bifunctional riboflavin biosynthesis protein RIBA 1, chloroplastic-like [Nicotiana tabacum]
MASIQTSMGFSRLRSYHALYFLNPTTANYKSDLSSLSLARKLPFSFKSGGKILRATLISGEDNVWSCYSNRGAENGSFVNHGAGIQQQPDTIAVGTPTAEITPNRSGFLSGDDEFDLDHTAEGFSSIPEAIEDIRQGKMVIVVDDEDRENEGDLIMAAELATPEAMAFIVKHGTGIVCASMKGEDLDRLQLPLMVPPKENEEKLSTAFTVSVDAKYGTTTGVSARDRAKTVLALASKDSRPEDFNRPGHIFPLKYREGGVLKRAGHTEASVDLAVLAGLDPVAVLCEIVDDDGSMARLPRLRQFAEVENLKIISIADLIRYRRKREKLVELAAAAPIPTMWGPFKAYCFKSVLDGIEHIAMVKGDIGDGKDVLVRVHSECLTGDIFGSARCDCGKQLALAMKQIEQAGRGVLVYLRGHEGRGIGLGHKLRAYNLQDDGHDTVEANEELGLPVDSREYGIGAQILRDLGVRTMKLMTNNPAKYVGLKGYGLAIAGRVPLLAPITTENRKYLETKRVKLGHVYGSDGNGHINGSEVGRASSDELSDNAA